MKIKKSRIYTKKIFCELLGIVLNIRMINNTLMIVNKKECIEDHAYYKFSSINNKKYLTSYGVILFTTESCFFRSSVASITINLKSA